MVITSVSYTLMVNNLAALCTKWIHYTLRLISWINTNLFKQTSSKNSRTGYCMYSKTRRYLISSF